MPTFRFSDGLQKSLPAGSRISVAVDGLVARGLVPIGATVDGKTLGLDSILPDVDGAIVEPLYKGDAAALGLMRHSAAHVMARAVMRLFEEWNLPSVQPWQADFITTCEPVGRSPKKICLQSKPK